MATAYAGILSAAIPVIGQVVNAIFAKHDKVSKEDANNALSSEKSASSDALKSLSDELQTISDLLEFCLPAEDAV